MEQNKQSGNKEDNDAGGDQQSKFDKNIHAGTRYDPKKGIRVPVSSTDQLPKLKNTAELILEL